MSSFYCQHLDVCCPRSLLPKETNQVKKVSLRLISSLITEHLLTGRNKHSRWRSDVFCCCWTTRHLPWTRFGPEGLKLSISGLEEQDFHARGRGVVNLKTSLSNEERKTERTFMLFKYVQIQPHCSNNSEHEQSSL